MRWLCAALLAAAVTAPALGSPASDAAYDAGKRHVEAREMEMGLALLDKAAAADPEAPSGHRARLLQLFLLDAQVGRCLSALSSYDRGLRKSQGAAAVALRQQREEVAAEGSGWLRELLRASDGYRQHVPTRGDCALELTPPATWNLSVINSAEAKIEGGHALTGTERARYAQETLRVWFYLTSSQFFCRPGRDDIEVVEKVRAAMKAGERVDPWIALAATVDTLAAVVNRSLVDGELGRARVAHHELRYCVSALLLKAPPDEGIVARAKAEASVKQVLGAQRGAEWFHDMEFAVRLVKAREEAAESRQ
jgi:hypothetical protein